MTRGIHRSKKGQAGRGFPQPLEAGLALSRKGRAGTQMPDQMG